MAGDPAEWVVGLERYREMLECLTARELAVVALALEGLNGEEIAALLGLHRRDVYQRLLGARRRLLRKFPEIRGMVEGRTKQVGVSRYRVEALGSGG